MSASSAFTAGNPPSMPAGSHEMRDYYSDQGPPRATPHTAPSITPYLGLRARLSQIWINRWTVLLLLVLVRTLIAISGIDHDLGSARREALSACSDVESMGSAMASMPHYMSQGLNELAATGVEKSVNGLMQTTTMSVNAVEEIVLFVIGMMTNTYLCLTTLAVNGSLHSVVNVLDSAQDNLQNLTSSLGTEISSAVTDFTSAYDKAVDALKSVPLVGTQVDLPKNLDLTTQLTTLKNFKFPSGLDADLQKLNNSIPTFAQVQNLTKNAIRPPFEDVKNLINQSLGNYTFNRSLFSVPEKTQLTFCSDDNGINEFFDHLVHLASTARKLFTGVLLTAAILVCIPMAWREIRRWRLMQAQSHLINSNEREPLDVVYAVSRPYTASAGIRYSNGFTSTRRQNLTRWVIAYATSDAALFVLALAIAGFFSCLCQIILLKSLEKEVPDLTNQVGAFADKVISQLNSSSKSWASATNGAISHISHDINTDMLGWVTTTTNALNETLNTFVDVTVDVLNSTFGGTPLHDPLFEVLNCLALLKAQGIESGLTWVHDNAHINFPQLRQDSFSIGAIASIASENNDPSESFLSSPGDQATDKISSAVARFVNNLEDAIRTEALVSTGIFLVWLLVVFIGIGRALWLWFGHDKTRGEGGAATAMSRSLHNPPTINDFRADNQDRYRSEFTEIPLGNVNNVRPFTPAPRYSESKDNSGFAGGEVDYQDQKLGFAVRQSHEQNISSRNQSQRGSIWTVDNKI